MTTTNLPETEILKTDVLGRVRMSVQRREAILDEFEKSGVAGAPFAKMIGVNYQTFASWIQKRRKARGQYRCLPAVKKAPALKFAEVVVAAESSGKTTLTVELPGGARVKVESPEQMELMCRLLTRLDKKETRIC
jgi:transposase